MQIINPNAFNTIEELDLWFKEWKSCTYKQRKISHDESIKLYGKNIYQMYDDVRSKLLANNTDDVDDDPNDDIDTTYADNIMVEAGLSDILADDELRWYDLIIKARNAEALGEIIMVDTTHPIVTIDSYNTDTVDYLEKKWRQLQGMSSDLRIRSDQTAQSIFGINNINLYNVIKNFVINKLEDEANDTTVDIEDIEHRNTINIDYDDLLFSEISMYLVEDDCNHSTSVNEAGRLTSMLCTMENHSTQKDTPIQPYFSPKEMIGYGVLSEEKFYSNHPDDTLIKDRKSWFDTYQYFGMQDTSIWEAALIDLYRDYNQILESGDMDKINARKQAILELGWNPEINFSHESASRTYYRNPIQDIKQIDVSSYYMNYDVSDIFNEDSMKDNMIFTISTNEGLFVSYDMKRGIFCERSQFQPCSIQRFNEMSFRGKRNIMIHCAYIDSNCINDYHNLLNMYRTNSNTPLYHVCREAVSLFDYKQSGPNVIKALFSENAKCFLLYDDSKNKTHIRYNIIYQMIREIAEDPDISLEESVARKMLREGTIAQVKACLRETSNRHGKNVYGLLTPSYEYIHERVKIGTNEKGDIVIRNVHDVNTEFFKCHRNLLSYEKANNYEGMKEELCKLKYLDNYAVKHMKNKDSKNYKEYADAHARITNDFNKYLKIITDHEPDFNFTKYYEQSPWYDGGVKISKSFMDWLGELIGRILTRR